MWFFLQRKTVWFLRWGKTSAKCVRLYWNFRYRRTEICVHKGSYRGADKSLARPDWKSDWKVAIFRPTRRSLLPWRPGWTDNFLDFFEWLAKLRVWSLWLVSFLVGLLTEWNIYSWCSVITQSKEWGSYIYLSPSVNHGLTVRQDQNCRSKLKIIKLDSIHFWHPYVRASWMRWKGNAISSTIAASNCTCSYVLLMMGGGTAWKA